MFSVHTVILALHLAALPAVVSVRSDRAYALLQGEDVCNRSQESAHTQEADNNNSSVAAQAAASAFLNSSQSRAEAAPSYLLVSKGKGENREPAQVNIRPSFKDNKPDRVSFGILLENWYGIDLARDTWDVDVVLTLQWYDSRNDWLLQWGAKKLRLSTEDAKQQMWLPDIKVTNCKDAKNYKISSSVLIEPNGKITKVERLVLTMKEHFKTELFPFDTQDLRVVLASGTYMKEEVQLEPIKDTSSWGAAAEKFNDSVWSLLNTSLTSTVEEEGPLTKSRGVLMLKVKRDPSEYRSSIFLPSVIFLFTTWSTLWLPLEGPYITPRVAINSFALLCQVTISQTANKMLPATGQESWITVYLEVCVELQFVVMLINMVVTSIEHKTGRTTLAKRLNLELSISYPITTVISVLLLSSEQFLTCRIWMIAVGVSNVVYLSLRYYFDTNFEK